MFKEELIKKYLYFDVETASGFESYADLLIKNERLALLWDKRCKYYRSAFPELSESTESEIYEEKSPLEPEFSRVVCVSFGTFDEDGLERFISFNGEDEHDILTKANKVFNNAHIKGWKLCGHNIKSFDVPCLGKRMLYQSINPSGNIQIWDKKPWEIPYIDTSEVFSFGSWVQQKYLSLDLVSCMFGVESPKGSMDGSQVTKVFWQDRNYDKIKEYCENDVRTVMEIVKKSCF
jgi:hypothetical protein